VLVEIHHQQICFSKFEELSSIFGGGKDYTASGLEEDNTHRPQFVTAGRAPPPVPLCPKIPIGFPQEPVQYLEYRTV